jgi:uncharacterized membrane protein YkvA (DUF1232 family)
VSRLEAWRQRARLLKREAYALYFACRDPRTPWYAKVVAATVVAYVFSPIDPIPDFIPVLGLLDELVVVPLGVALVLKMVPPEVLRESRERADRSGERPVSSVAAGFIVAVWLAVAAGAAFLVYRWLWP